MKRRFAIYGVVVGALAGVVGAFIVRASLEEAEEVEAHEQRRQARIEREAEREAEEIAGLQEESSGLMPSELSGVALGITRDELEAVRDVSPRIGQGEEGLLFLEEELENGARVIYGVNTETERLGQVQVMSSIDSAEGIGQHLQAMIERYGQPTGIWNCPRTGNVSTRRFTWRGAHATIADVFLIYGNRASLTFYLAPNERIGESLSRAACRPVQSPEELAEFPTASIEQIRQAQQGTAAP